MPAVHRRTAMVLAVAAVVAAPPAAGASWRLPVDGAAVARPFDLGTNPFEGGRHRGIDLTARAGDLVRSPCAGEVVVAGRVGTSGRVVTVRCGRWRVSHMPLSTIAIRIGDHVRRGAPIGAAARSPDHHGLHLGVRREGDRFGYVDPLRFLAAKRIPPPIAGGRRPPTIRVTRPPRLGPAPRAPRPATNPLRRAAPAGLQRAGLGPAGLERAGPAARPHSKGSNPAAVPWPAWAGTVLMLAGLGVGRRVRLRVRGGIARHRPAEGVP